MNSLFPKIDVNSPLIRKCAPDTLFVGGGGWSTYNPTEILQLVPELDLLCIGEAEETEYFKEKKLQISIFMSPFDVHINRHPISGTIQYYKYHKGKYLVAWHPKSSTKNERTTTVIENKKIKLLVRQIAGLVARRIINYSKVGSKVDQASQLGFIKFGSRADIFLPLSFKPSIKVGDKTTGGVTILGSLN